MAECLSEADSEEVMSPNTPEDGRALADFSFWYTPKAVVNDGLYEREVSTSWSLTFFEQKFHQYHLMHLWKRYLLRSCRAALSAFYFIVLVYVLAVLLTMLWPQDTFQCDKAQRLESNFCRKPDVEQTLPTSGNVCAHATDETDPPLQGPHHQGSELTTSLLLAACGTLSVINLCIVQIRDVFIRVARVTSVLSIVVYSTFLILIVVDVRRKERSVLINNNLAADEVSLFMLLIFVGFTFLPLSRWIVVTMNASVALASVATEAVVLCGEIHKANNLSTTDVGSTGVCIRQMIAVTLMIVAATIAGFYHYYVSDLAYRRTLLKTHNFIASNYRLEKLKQQESQRKKELLLKIIPEQLIHQMQSAIAKGIFEPNFAQNHQFYDLIIERHKDVTILFSDVVNFATMTRCFSASKLVSLLNLLYSEFDVITERQGCRRIKILGDCYYLISDIYASANESLEATEAARCDARKVVCAGLAMISVIEMVRRKFRFNDFGMRIGIHTGLVLAGVIGLKKWQFDIYSNDVLTANQTETTGQADRVHVTATTVQLLDPAEFVCVENESLNDDWFAQHHLATFWVTWRSAPSSRKASTTAETRPAPSTDPEPAPISPSDHEIIAKLGDVYHLTDASTDFTKNRLWMKTKFSEIDPVLLRFKNKALEQEYSEQGDQFVSVAIISSYGLYGMLSVTMILSMPHETIFFAANFVGHLAFAALITVVYCPWPPLLCFLIERLRSQRSSAGLVTSIVAVIFFGTVALQTAGCTYYLNRYPPFGPNDSELCHDGSPMHLFRNDSCGKCAFPTLILQFIQVGMMAVSLFLRVSHLTKAMLMALGPVLFLLTCVVKYNDHCNIFDGHCSEFFDGNIRVRGLFVLLGFLFVLVTKSRQQEKNFRVDYLWQSKMQRDQRELEESLRTNQQLLENILPKHVLEHFVAARANGHLYSRLHRNVCVMFLCVPQLKCGLSDDVESIRPLNEIAVLFDRVLNGHKGVEKIKTVSGSKFMYCTGLEDDGEKNQDLQVTNVVTMLEFASAVQRDFSGFKDDLMAHYTLRIGLACGEVVAGVIGVLKPLYDVWGDTVNIASRMECIATDDTILAPHFVAHLLRQCNQWTAEWEGMFHIKGVGRMGVYFIAKHRLLRGHYQPHKPRQHARRR